jgi:hypothetical protein
LNVCKQYLDAYFKLNINFGENMRYGICNKPLVPLYEAAKFCLGAVDLASGVADELLYGWLVRINDEDKAEYNCARVTTEYGYSGYVDLSDLMIIPAPAEMEKYGNVYYVDRHSMDILCEPKVTARPLMTLHRGSFVRAKSLQNAKDDWLSLVLNNGTVGFVQACMLKKRPIMSMRNDSRLRQAIVASARGYMGTQYRWGGKTPLGIDCSGLTFMSYFENGIYIYRDAKLMNGYPVRKIPNHKMEAGDLLYFPGHIAMYLGKGQYIHATARAGSFGVVINSLNPQALDFRADLYEKLEAVGSIF